MGAELEHKLLRISPLTVTPAQFKRHERSPEWEKPRINVEMRGPAIRGNQVSP
jgi:hypothetical protein